MFFPGLSVRCSPFSIHLWPILILPHIFNAQTVYYVMVRLLVSKWVGELQGSIDGLVWSTVPGFAWQDISVRVSQSPGQHLKPDIKNTYKQLGITAATLCIEHYYCCMWDCGTNWYWVCYNIIIISRPRKELGIFWIRDCSGCRS